MRQEDLLQCPLLHGLDAMHRAQLLDLLKDSNLGESVERCVAGVPRPASDQEKTPADTDQPQPHDFQKKVHNWNPEFPSWRRSNKE